MKIYIVCQQKYEEDGKTKQGAVRYLTIDNGWSELIEYAAIFTKHHGEYIAEKHQKSFRDYCAAFFVQEIKNV